MFSLQSGAQKIDAFQSPEVLAFSTYGSVNGLLFNPNRQVDDDVIGGNFFNPLTDTEFREAFNWLLDRDQMNLQILEGFAVKFVVPMHPTGADYAREIDTFQAIEDQYVGDFARAKSVMEARLAAMGATRDTGGDCSAASPGFCYVDAQGELIDLRIIARVEDERLVIGQFVGSQLFRVGIHTTVISSPAGAAIGTVYGGAPDQGAWHIYTEGWGFTANVAWDDFQIWFFHACVFEPFCAQFGGTYAPPQDFIDQSTDLAFGGYTSLAERQQWVRELTPRTLSEANYRMWIQAEQAVFPVSQRIEGVVMDNFGGPWTHFTLKSARLVAGEPGVSAETGVGGDIRVLNFIGFASAWNPWRGNWLYDSIQYQTLSDPGIYLHPHTGQWIDYRMTHEVETAGPTGTLTVPSTALHWDMVNLDRFVQVGAGVTAVSKVTSSLGPSPGMWHTGQEINMDDVVYGVAAAMRRSFGDVVSHDVRAASGGEKFYWANTVKGIEFDLAANTVTLYIDYWHVDEAEIAALGSTYMSTVEFNTPWEIQEIGLQTVLNDATRIHETTATGDGLPWLDLVRNPQSVAALDEAYTQVAGLVPQGMAAIPGLGDVITPAESTARYSAAKAFRDNIGHWLASNGPFMLQRLDPVFRQAVMVAFRDGYPFTPDHWDDLKIRRVPSASFGAFPTDLLAGRGAVLDVSTSEAGSPADARDVRWFIRQEATGGVPIRGDAVRTDVGAYEVQVLSTQTVGLETGGYSLVVVVQGEQGSITQEFAFTVTSQIDFFQALFETVDDRLGQTQSQIADLSTNVGTLQGSTASLQTLVTAVLALAVIAIVVPAAMLFVILRRLPAAKPPASPPEMMPEGGM